MNMVHRRSLVLSGIDIFSITLAFCDRTNRIKNPEYLIGDYQGRLSMSKLGLPQNFA